MSFETATAAAPGYPLRFDVEYPEQLSRWLIFVKWLLAIPHFLILYALGAVANVITFIAFFAVLLTGRYPRGLFPTSSFSCSCISSRSWSGSSSGSPFCSRDDSRAACSISWWGSTAGTCAATPTPLFSWGTTPRRSACVSPPRVVGCPHYGGECGHP